MKIQTHTRHLRPEHLKNFFVNWPNPPSPQKLLQILQNSTYIALAINEQNNQVVGFITAISDQIIAAYIPLLEVLPEYQKQGIGAQLIQSIKDQTQHLYMLDLCCDENLISYYETQNFTPTRGMIFRNYDRQNCS